MRRRIPALLFAVLLTPAWGSFGKNKVQYERKEWRYLQSPHFDIYYTKKGRSLAVFAAGELEPALKSITDHIHYRLKKRIPVIIYKSHAEFEQTNVLLEDIDEGIGGFTESMKSRVVVPFEGSFPDFQHVLHHELTHAVMYDLIFENVFNALRYRASFHIPLWVAEGWAEHESAGWNLESDMFLMDAVISGYIAGPEYDFGHPYLAYKAGMAFFNFMAVQYGDKAVGDFIKFLSLYKNVEKAFERACRTTLKKASDRFLLDLRKKYWPELGKRENAEEIAKRLTRHRTMGFLGSMPDSDPLAHFNLQPAVSPDGRWIAYFSDREDFEGIYVMEARTGKIKKKLLKSGSSGKFESFHSFRSGFAWSPDSRQIVFVSMEKGRDVLRMVDIETRKVMRTVRPGLDRLESPDWDPSGNLLAFSGLNNAVADLYIYDLAAGRLKKLTSDGNFDTRPRFSPDGKTIAFESEFGEGPRRGEKNSEIFMIGSDGAGLRRVTENPFSDVMPCFSADGKHLYFISNRSGLSNLYVTALDTLAPRAVTNIFTGCFTPSIPRKGDFVVFSVFENGGWDVFRMEEPLKKAKEASLSLSSYAASLNDTGVIFWKKYEALPDPADTAKKDTAQAGDSSRAAAADTVRASRDTAAGDEDGIFGPQTLGGSPFDPFNRDRLMRPEPREARRPAVDTSDFIHDTTVFKTPSGSYREHDYRPKFTLDAVSAMVGAGFSPNSFAMMGQTALSLSDILGNHHFDLMANIYGSSIEHLNYYLAYYYLPFQLDVGGSTYRFINLLQQVRDSAQSDFYLRNQWYLDALYNATADVVFPFSKYFRVGFQGGFNWIDRKREFYTLEPDDGYVSHSEAAGSLYHLNLGLETVYDNSLWGFVGPVNGRRLNVSTFFVPPAGNSPYSYGVGMADVRQYWHFIKRFTVAARFSGGVSKPLLGGENPWRFYLGGTSGDLSNLFLPYFLNPSLETNYFSAVAMPLRGYSIGGANPSGNSRYALANLEFRFPFVQRVVFDFPFPFQLYYLMAAVFWDAGAAWDEFSTFRGVRRGSGGTFTFNDIKSGAGLGLRLNLMGAFVLKWDRALRLGPDHVVEDYFSLGAEF